MEAEEREAHRGHGRDVPRGESPPRVHLQLTDHEESILVVRGSLERTGGWGRCSQQA